MTRLKRKTVKKRVLIQFRATEEIKKLFQEYAKIAGMNMTDFFYFCTLNIPPRSKMATPEREILLLILSEISKANTELNKTTVNLNQIAKVMNTENKTFYSVMVKETLIVETLEDLRATLRDNRALSSKVLNLFEGGNAGKNTGERGATGDLSSEESGQ